MKHLFSKHGCIRCGRTQYDCVKDGELQPCDNRINRCWHQIDDRNMRCALCKIDQRSLLINKQIYVGDVLVEV